MKDVEVKVLDRGKDDMMTEIKDHLVETLRESHHLEGVEVMIGTEEIVIDIQNQAAMTEMRDHQGIEIILEDMKTMITN